MNKEVNELLDKLGELEEAPLIWVNKKVYDTSKEIEKLNNQLQQKENIIKEVREEIRILESNCDISDYQARKLYQLLDKGE